MTSHIVSNTEALKSINFHTAMKTYFLIFLSQFYAGIDSPALILQHGAMNILFVCTHNRCRSILAEAIFSSHAGNLVLNVKSAGSQPAGKVHPESLLALRRNKIPCEHLQSQSWEDFSQWPCDLIITVCDSAAQESCPHYFSSAQVLHWPLKDPSSIEGSESQRIEAFDKLVAQLQSAANEFCNRIKASGPKSAIDCLIEYGAKHKETSNSVAL